MLSTGSFTPWLKTNVFNFQALIIIFFTMILLMICFHAHLFCLLAPPRLLSSPNPVYSYVGNWKPTIILCKFSGYPAPLVKMVNQNRTEVASGNGSTSFTIPSTDSEDVFGKYNCSAVNKFGNDGVLLELKVAGKLFKCISLFVSVWQESLAQHRLHHWLHGKQLQIFYCQYVLFCFLSEFLRI